MKFHDQIKLAAYNLIRRKKTSIQCIAMITVIMLLLSICSFFIVTLTIQLRDSIDNYASTNYVDIYTYRNVYDDSEWENNGWKLLPTESQITQLKNKFSSIKEIKAHLECEMVFIPTKQILIIDGISYHGDDNIDKWSSAIRKDKNQATFSQNDYAEFNTKFAGEELIKYGRDIENDGEILFPEELLASYGVTAEQILSAETVALNFSADIIIGSTNPIIFNGKVVGIYNKNFSKLGGNEKGRFSEILIFIEKNAETGLVFSKDIIRLYLNGALEVDEMREHIYNEFGLDTSYGNSSVQNRLELTGKILIFVLNIIVILFGAVGLALIVFLYSVLEYNARQKGGYYGMVRAMGLKSTRALTLIEIVILTVVSSVACLIIFIPTIFLLNGVVISFSWASRYTITISGGLVALTFLLSFMAVALLNILLALFSSKRHNTKTITAALRS